MVAEWGRSGKLRSGERRPIGALLLILVLGVAVAGCGSEAGGKDDLAITVAAKGTAEEAILVEIYAQGLEAAGFEVRRHRSIPPGLPPFEQKGLRISGYPEHLNIALKDILGFKGSVPGDAARAYALTKEGLEEKGLTAFPPTSFSRSKAVGVLRSTAEERGLKTLSGLTRQAGEMTVKATEFCRALDDCLNGLEEEYGIAFEAYSAIEPPLRYRVLEDGEADASILLSTEGRLAGRNSRFVILEDDRHLLPAGNVSWVTTTDLAEKLGPRYERAIVDAQRGLTLKVMQRLNAEVNLEGKSPAGVAARYLRPIHIVDRERGGAS